MVPLGHSRCHVLEWISPPTAWRSGGFPIWSVALRICWLSPGPGGTPRPPGIISMGSPVAGRFWPRLSSRRGCGQLRSVVSAAPSRLRPRPPVADACSVGARGQRGRCGDAHGAPSCWHRGGSCPSRQGPASEGESQHVRPRPGVREPCLPPRGHQSTRGSLVAGGRLIQKDGSRDWDDLSKIDGGAWNRAWTRARSICTTS